MGNTTKNQDLTCIGEIKNQWKWRKRKDCRRTEKAIRYMNSKLVTEERKFHEIYSYYQWYFYRPSQPFYCPRVH